MNVFIGGARGCQKGRRRAFEGHHDRLRRMPGPVRHRATGLFASSIPPNALETMPPDLTSIRYCRSSTMYRLVSAILTRKFLVACFALASAVATAPGIGNAA